MKHKCTKIKSGEYKYRGFTIYNLGYHHPDSSIYWETVNDEENNWVVHAATIDYDLDYVQQNS